MQYNVILCFFKHSWRSCRSMFSLCSVPSTCLQNAISSSAKTARPRRGALDSTYWRPALRLPGSRRALGLAKQGLKSYCKLAFRSKSLQREHGSAAAHDVAVTATQQLPPYVLTERHLWSRGSLPISGAVLRGGSASSREVAVVGKPNK